MRKENFKLSIIISLIVVISLSATYAYMELSTNAQNAATGQGGCFEVNYTGQAINNSSLQSTTDYTQGATSEIVLSKNENCDIYTTAQILIHTNTTDTDVPFADVKAMKYKIIKNAGEETQVDVATGVINGTEDQTLATVNLTETATTYTVYLWIDPEVSQGAYHGKTYSGYLYASATQTSTVTG